ncbi:MAG: TRAP transporter small permease [Marinobacterium sp.]|nr:TRAP transporter small permease [Marinobacterium sp.]
MGRLLLRFFDKLENYLCRLLLAGFVCLLFMQILARQLFEHSFSWSEELSIYMFVWFVFLGASYATRREAHNRVTFHYRWLPEKLTTGLKLLADLIWVVFNCYFVYLSYDFVFNRMNLFWKSQTLGIPMKYIYMILPLAFSLMTIRILQVNYYRYLRPQQTTQGSTVNADNRTE